MGCRAFLVAAQVILQTDQPSIGCEDNVLVMFILGSTQVSHRLERSALKPHLETLQTRVKQSRHL